MSFSNLKRTLSLYIRVAIVEYFHEFKNDEELASQDFHWVEFFIIYENSEELFPRKWFAQLFKSGNIELQEVWSYAYPRVKEYYVDFELPRKVRFVELDDMVYYTMEALVYEEFEYIDNFQELKEHIQNYVEDTRCKKKI